MANRRYFQANTVGPRVMRRWLAAALIALTASACDGVFDVDNPNELVQDDLEKPSATAALVNGAEATVARGAADGVLAISIPTDELVWVGSYDAGRELDTGFLKNPVNEFTNNEAWDTFAEGRFMADEAIRLLGQFEADGMLRDRAALARAYLYGATIYTYAADWWDEFVISDRKEPGPPISESEMAGMYDAAIEYATSGIAVARSIGSSSLEASLLAARARAHFARAVWQKLNPAGNTPASPLVSAPPADADAAAVLAMVQPDWALEFEYGPTTVGNQLGSWINSRQEFRVDTLYGVPRTSGTRIQDVALLDPIDGVPDAALRTRMEALGLLASTTELYPRLTVVSARELHLILAESALEAGRTEDFATHVNAVRAIEGRTAWSGQVPALDILLHERRVNLFLQGRRLADMYRFGIQDARWLSSSDAATTPGTFFPIADMELKSNCYFQSGGCGG